MFLKNDLRPAMAVTAGNSDHRINRQKQTDAFTYAATSETEDFNAFHTSTARDEMGNRPARQPRPQKNGSKAPLLWIIIAAAAVLLLLVAVLAFALGADKNITFKDNAYLAYSEDDGNYKVAVNGSVLEFDFEGEVEVIPSADHAFAYVVDNTAEGVNIYLLEGKNLSMITLSPVTEALAFASVKPGVIYRNDNKYYLYSEKVGEEYFAKDVKDCILSGDATTVVYTKPDKNNAAETDLYLHVESSGDTIASDCAPVALSTYGDYLYVKAKDADGIEALYVIETKKPEDKIPVSNSTGFVGITAMNIKGTEVIFNTINTEKVVSTSLFRLKKKTTQTLANSAMKLETVDPSIAMYDTFANTYLSGMTVSEDGVSYPTYHLSKKFECYKISSYQGQFSPNGEYFYYINNDDELMEMDLTDKNRAKKRLFEDVVSYAITEKGNVYVLNLENELRFYKLSTGKKTSVSHDAIGLSIYNYANNVYFSEMGETDVSVYVSEEGSDKEISKFGNTQITNVPSFTHPHSKKTYAYYYDTESGAVMLFYSSNGRSFKLITQDCAEISGFEITT